MYSLHTLPVDKTHWGPVRNGTQDQSKILYVNGQALTVWAIAELQYADLKDRGNWRRRPRIKFKPLLKEDAEVAQKLYAGKACPVKSK